jgi:transposase
VRRFSSAKRIVAYAGLAPGQHESAGYRQQLGISKQGSRLLRWVLVEAAWRRLRCSRRVGNVFEALHKRRGKKAMVALLRSGQAYRLAGKRVGRRPRQTTQ